MSWHCAVAPCGAGNFVALRLGEDTDHSSLPNPSLRNKPDAPPVGGLFRRDSFSLQVPRVTALVHSLLVLFRQTLPKGNELRQRAEDTMTENTPTTPEAAAETFVTVWAKSDTVVDIARSLTCPEADALAGLLAAYGHHLVAEECLTEHACTDEDGDSHFASTAEEYVVPIDPMDDLQCDSCQ